MTGGGGDRDVPRHRALDAVAARRFDDALGLLPALAAQLPDDPLVAFAHAEALWGTGDPGAALARFEAALTRDPACLRLRARYGLALIAAGRAVEALDHLERALAALPADQPVAALAEHFATPLAFTPVAGDAACQLGQTLLAAGRLDDAIAALRHAVALDDTAALPRLLLGGALALRGEVAGALAAYRAAVRLAPEDALGWRALAEALRRLGPSDEAEACAQAAHSLERRRPDRALCVGNALMAAGAETAAHDWLVRSMASAAWARDIPAPADGRLRVGVLAAPGRVNTPLDFVLDTTAHAVEPILLLDGFAYPDDRIAASYHVLFNAVADPDRGSAAVALADALAARIGLPVINPPRAILATTRERVAERLAGIDGCVAPATARHDTAALRSAAGLARAIAEIGLPLLARPVGSHGGAAIERLDSAPALAAYVAWPAAGALYLTRFHDYRSPDGRYRKYRLIFVDGEPLPYHLAIGDDWLVHYVGTPMAEDAHLRDEEAAFLADWRGALGARAAAALDAIGGAIGLDYAGIDCALLPDGRLLLFECNAAMLVRHVDQPPMFDYKRASAERIRSAVSAMLARRASA